jgi:hypothetical protein
MVENCTLALSTAFALGKTKMPISPTLMARMSSLETFSQIIILLNLLTFLVAVREKSRIFAVATPFAKAVSRLTAILLPHTSLITYGCKDN